jgi:hypothetical protein
MFRLWFLMGIVGFLYCRFLRETWYIIAGAIAAVTALGTFVAWVSGGNAGLAAAWSAGGTAVIALAVVFIATLCSLKDMH